MTADERALARAEREKNHAEWRKREEERRREREAVRAEIASVTDELLVVRTLLEAQVEDLDSEAVFAERSLLDSIRRGLEEHDPWTESFVLAAAREREKKLRSASEAAKAVSAVFAILGAGEGPHQTPVTDALMERSRELLEHAKALEDKFRRLS